MNGAPGISDDRVCQVRASCGADLWLLRISQECAAVVPSGRPPDLSVKTRHAKGANPRLATSLISTDDDNNWECEVNIPPALVGAQAEPTYTDVVCERLADAVGVTGVRE